jgi:glycosyltransferase involved in cell wall biosynthesis
MPEFGGDAVIYFDPSSPRDFAEKITSFIDDQSTMDALALKARERAAIYDWKETARQTWASLEKLCEEKV